MGEGISALGATEIVRVAQAQRGKRQSHRRPQRCDNALRDYSRVQGLIPCRLRAR